MTAVKRIRTVGIYGGPHAPSEVQGCAGGQHAGVTWKTSPNPRALSSTAPLLADALHCGKEQSRSQNEVSLC